MPNKETGEISDAIKYQGKEISREDAQSIASELKKTLNTAYSNYSNAIHRTDGAGGLLTMGTNAWANYGTLMGYDAIRFKNIQDSKYVNDEVSDVYAILSGDQIKNARLVEGVDYTKPGANKLLQRGNDLAAQVGSASSKGLDYINDSILGRISSDEAEKRSEG